MEGRKLPVEIEAEQAVIGSMLQTVGGIEAIETVRAILTPSDFWRPAHQQIYRAILEIHDTRSPATGLPTISYEKLYGDIPESNGIPTPLYIETLRASTLSAANAEYYAERVKEASRRRKLIRVLDSISAKACDMDADTTSVELVGELQDAIDKNQMISSAASKIPDAKDDWPEVFSQLCKSQKCEFLGLQTGFNRLDKATLGLRGLSVLGGIPGQGKTSFALQLATQIAEINGVPVLFYALEMSKRDLHIKIISRLSGLDYTTLTVGSEINGRRGQGLTDSDNSRFSKAIDEFAQYADRVKIIDRTVCKAISLPVVKLHIQQVKRESNADQAFIVVDRLQTFPCDKPWLDDTKSRLDYLVAEFKAISEQLNATVLLISEKNSEFYTWPALPESIGNAGIEYGVDLAAFLHEDGEGEEDAGSFQMAEESNRDLELRIAKNRFGKRARIKLRFYADTSRFAEEIW